MGVVGDDILGVGVAEAVGGTHLDMGSIRIFQRISPHRVAGVVVVIHLATQVAKQDAYRPNITTTHHPLCHSTRVCQRAIAHQIGICRFACGVEMAHFARLHTILIDLDRPAWVGGEDICQEGIIIEWQLLVTHCAILICARRLGT